MCPAVQARHLDHIFDSSAATSLHSPYTSAPATQSTLLSIQTVACTPVVLQPGSLRRPRAHLQRRCAAQGRFLKPVLCCLAAKLWHAPCGCARATPLSPPLTLTRPLWTPPSVWTTWTSTYLRPTCMPPAWRRCSCSPGRGEGCVPHDSGGSHNLCRSQIVTSDPLIVCHSIASGPACRTWCMQLPTSACSPALVHNLS